MRRALLLAAMVVTGSFAMTAQAQTLRVVSVFGGVGEGGPGDDVYLGGGFRLSEPMLFSSYAFALSVSSPDLVIDPVDGFWSRGVGSFGPETYRWTFQSPVMIFDQADPIDFFDFHFVVSPTAQAQDIFVTAYQPLGSNWDWVGGPNLPTRPDFGQATWVVHVVPAPSAAAMMMLGAPLVLGRRRREG